MSALFLWALAPEIMAKYSLTWYSNWHGSIFLLALLPKILFPGKDA